jgi:glucose-6-phosphate 1-dehydrogenase
LTVTGRTEVPSPAAGAGSGASRPDPHVIVLFGAGGDLAARKLIPGFFHLQAAGLLPDEWRIVGNADQDFDDEGFREHARESIEKFGRRGIAESDFEGFQRRLSYVPISAGTDALGHKIADARKQIDGDCRLLHYLAVPPAAFGAITEELASLELTGPEARVVMEKPFGHDYESAVKLNELVHSVFEESQIFRIDHFLGKEAVQNVLALRFANGLFEPVWNRNNVEFVQIDVPETLSIGTRAGFYEGTGTYRDMIVTHLLQLLSFVAMEPPSSLHSKDLKVEKQKVFDQIKPIEPDDVVRGQYEGYRDTDGVAPDSDTETFAAVKVEIDNWRWAGVPFYLRTGKCMPESRHTVTLDFHEPPMSMFPGEVQHQGANQLVFEFSEPGEITADFQAKVPGPTMELGPARMTFRYEDSFAADNQLEAYERLIHDAMIGDGTLFTQAAGIERLWEVSMPALDNPNPVIPYAQGTWGPQEAADLVAPFGWRLPDSGPGRPTQSV